MAVGGEAALKKPLDRKNKAFQKRNIAGRDWMPQALIVLACVSKVEVRCLQQPSRSPEDKGNQSELANRPAFLASALGFIGNPHVQYHQSSYWFFSLSAKRVLWFKVVGSKPIV